MRTTSNAKRAKRAKKRFGFAVFAGFAFLAGSMLVAQDRGGLNPADLLKPLADSWTSYSGDYTGRRYSTLTQVNQSNVKQLSLAFTAKLTGGPGGGGTGPGSVPTLVGGEGDGSIAVGGATQL